jgi:diaminopimelate epimerase
MKIEFSKYEALGNDFLVIDGGKNRLSKSRLGKLATGICNRRCGVGADGILYLSKSNGLDTKADVFNADGSWAEKSGNGLRITAVHLGRSRKSRTQFRILMGGEKSLVTLGRQITGGFMVTAELGRPDFRASRVTVKCRSKYLINGPIKIGRQRLIATCLAIGNPHTVISVDDFDFDWKALGRELEHAPIFPRGTNVEFVTVLSASKLRVNDWERGAGATGSSGTGAAAAVCAMVTAGRANRKCEVRFEKGSLHVDWNADDNLIRLTGPVRHVMTGYYTWD